MSGNAWSYWRLVAQTEDILRRFTRSNVQHPVYRALSELGKAVKTIFLCRYLGSLQLRREIHEGLNVIESWNSANDFIFFGKAGEMASNRAGDREISMLSLHLLQLALVYVNTLMIQQILAEPAWSGRLNSHDLRGITPIRRVSVRRNFKGSATPNAFFA
jgi:TnpA family transposase